jgi:choline dehydrogenase-like flavoprotein
VHYAGSVRMHDDPRYGVLDRWNRMHDVPNVVVCDMSCFTTGPEKNPTPTAMALAIRAADRLADDRA